MAEVAKPAPVSPLPADKPIPKVFERFHGLEIPGFLRDPSPEKPLKPLKLEIIEDTQLSIDQLKVLKDAFDIFDNENKGAITLDVVKIILELFTGEEVNDDDLDDIMDEYDEDESGEIEFSEFIELAEHFVEPEENITEVKKELRDVFVLYDKEKRGFIPVSDFKGILKQIDPEVAESDLDKIVDEIDADSSGTIEFDEFIEVMIGEDEAEKRRKRRE